MRRMLALWVTLLLLLAGGPWVAHGEEGSTASPSSVLAAGERYLYFPYRANFNNVVRLDWASVRYAQGAWGLSYYSEPAYLDAALYERMERITDEFGRVAVPVDEEMRLNLYITPKSQAGIFIYQWQLALESLYGYSVRLSGIHQDFIPSYLGDIRASGYRFYTKEHGWSFPSRHFLVSGGDTVVLTLEDGDLRPYAHLELSMADVPLGEEKTFQVSNLRGDQFFSVALKKEVLLRENGVDRTDFEDLGPYGMVSEPVAEMDWRSLRFVEPLSWLTERVFYSWEAVEGVETYYVASLCFVVSSNLDNDPNAQWWQRLRDAAEEGADDEAMREILAEMFENAAFAVWRKTEETELDDVVFNQQKAGLIPTMGENQTRYTYTLLFYDPAP